MVKKIILKIKCLEIPVIKDLGAVEGSEASQCGTRTQSVAPTHVSLSTDTIMSNSSISVRQPSIIIQTAEAPQLNSPRTTHIRKMPGVVGDASMWLGTWDNFTLPRTSVWRQKASVTGSTLARHSTAATGSAGNEALSRGCPDRSAPRLSVLFALLVNPLMMDGRPFPPFPDPNSRTPSHPPLSPLALPNFCAHHTCCPAHSQQVLVAGK